MTNLFVNVVLALIWVVITGSFSFLNLIFGFLVGAMALHLVRERVGRVDYFSRLLRILSLAFRFILELLMSAWRVALTVSKPKMDVAPGFLAYELTLERDAEIALLANLITLTPGTLSVDVSPDRKVLYVHALDCSDPDEVRRSIREGFERKIREAFE